MLCEKGKQVGKQYRGQGWGKNGPKKMTMTK